MLLDLLHSFLAYGVLGILIEVFFTGVGSILHGHKKAVCVTYLWMVPIYGIAGLALEGISHLGWHWALLAPVYMLVMYLIEFTTGWLLKRLIGICPWDYGVGHWTPMGLINLKYAPFWLLLACCFNPISSFLQKALHLLASV